MSTIKKIQVDGVDYDIKASEVEGITIEEGCYLDIPSNDQPVTFIIKGNGPQDITLGKSASIGNAVQIGQNVKIEEGTELTWDSNNTLHIGTDGNRSISIPLGFNGQSGTGSSDLIVNMAELGGDNSRLYINAKDGAFVLGTDPDSFGYSLIKIAKGLRIGTDVIIGNKVYIDDDINIRRGSNSIIIGTNNPVTLYDGFDSSQISGGGTDIDWIKRIEYCKYELHLENDEFSMYDPYNSSTYPIRIGSSTLIGNEIFIGSNTTIGTGVETGDKVFIGSNTTINSDTTIGENTTIGKDVEISTNIKMNLYWGLPNRINIDNLTNLYQNSPSVGTSLIITPYPQNSSSRYDQGNSIVIHTGCEIHSMGNEPLKIKPYETGLVFECGDKKITLPWETN